MEDIKVNKDNMDFVVSPQMELLSVIQILAEEDKKEYKDWYANNNFYIESIRNYFDNFKNHPAVIHYRDFHINNSQIFNYSFNSISDKLTENEVQYFKILNDFVDKSNFKNFFISMSDYYKKVLTYNINNVNDLKIQQDLNNYYNQPIKINVIFKMIQGDWGEYINNDNNVFTILCGITEMKELPMFINYRQLSSLCFHECTHPFVNKHLTTDYDFLAKTESVFISIDENLPARKYYYTYNDYLEDLVVRAVTAYIHFKYGYSTIDEYNKELYYMEQIGFVYIKDIAKILETNDFYTSMELIKNHLYEMANKSKKDIL